MKSTEKPRSPHAREPLNIEHIGEFGLIDILRKKTASPGARGIVVGIGDDAFAARLRRGRVMVVSKDLLIENIHFRRDWALPFEIGYKSMAVNLSDLAAMGRCTPRFALIGLGLPHGVPVSLVTKLYDGMQAAARPHGLQIIGGDTVSAPSGVVISVTVIGEAQEHGLRTRAGARPGDLVAVTGTFGDAGAGLYILQQTGRPRRMTYLVRRHLLPEPRLAQAARLATGRRISSMLDSSDGLDASVHLIAQESGVALRIDVDRIPLSPALRALAARDRAVDPLALALFGGEEYELVFTLSPQDAAWAVRQGFSVTVIGTVTAGSGVTYYENNVKKTVAPSGFQHFHA